MSKKVVIGLAIVASILIVIGIAWQVIEMFIDHTCYQLEPNDFYTSTICERYWRK